MTSLSDSKVRNINPSTKTAGATPTCLALVASLALVPSVARASVEGSLMSVKQEVVGTLLPLAAICGLGFAALSFVVGHPSARQHLWYAILGAVVGFGADSIISLVRALIH